MIFNGVVGLAAAGLGWALQIGTPRAFILFWAAVAVVGLTGSLFLVRRQSLKEGEPFWSPPTRRVSQALLPPLTAGCLLSAVLFAATDWAPRNPAGPPWLPWLPLGWVVLYGCAFHAAGFFMPRGMKIFGWAFVVGGCGLLAAGLPDWARPLDYGHGVMGLFFGGLHLAYGGYLYFTERRGHRT
jgi:hypothetical protein